MTGTGRSEHSTENLEHSFEAQPRRNVLSQQQLQTTVVVHEPSHIKYPLKKQGTFTPFALKTVKDCNIQQKQKAKKNEKINLNFPQAFSRKKSYGSFLTDNRRPTNQIASKMTTAINLHRMVEAELEHGRINDVVRKSLDSTSHHEHLYTMHSFGRAAQYALVHGEKKIYHN